MKRKMFDKNDNFVGNQVYVEEGGSNKRPNKKPLMIVLTVLVVILVGVGGFLLGKKLYESNKEKETSKYDLASVIDKVYEFDDGTKYLKDVSEFYGFEVSSKDVKYKLYDGDDNEVESEIIEKDGKYYVVAVNGFESGKTYYIEILDDSGTFVDEKLADTSKLTFTTKYGSSSNSITYASTTKTATNSSLIKKASVKKIDVSGKNVNVGDVVVLTDDDGNSVGSYKVNSIDSDGVASVTQVDAGGTKVSVTTSSLLDNTTFGTLNISGTGVTAGEILYVTDGGSNIAAFEVTSVNGNTASVTKISVSDADKSSANKKTVTASTLIQNNPELTVDLLKKDSLEIINTSGTSVSAGDALIVTDNGKYVAAYKVESVNGNTAAVTKIDVSDAEKYSSKKMIDVSTLLNNNTPSDVNSSSLGAEDEDVINVKDQNGNTIKSYKLEDSSTTSSTTATEVSSSSNNTVTAVGSSAFINSLDISTINLTGAVSSTGDSIAKDNIILIHDNNFTIAAYRVNSVSGNTANVTKIDVSDAEQLISNNPSTYVMVKLSAEDFLKYNTVSSASSSVVSGDTGDYVAVKTSDGTIGAVYKVTNVNGDTTSLSSSSTSEAYGSSDAKVLNSSAAASTALDTATYDELAEEFGDIEVGQVLVTYGSDGVSISSAKKVTAINDDGTVELTDASLEEIGDFDYDYTLASLSDLDVDTGAISVKVDDTIKNSGIYTTIADSVAKTGGTMTSQFSITKEGNGFRVILVISVNAGEGFLGLKGTQNHSITFAANLYVGLEADLHTHTSFLCLSGCNIEVSVTTTESLTLNIDIQSTYRHDTNKVLRDTTTSGTIGISEEDVYKALEVIQAIATKGDSLKQEQDLGGLDLMIEGTPFAISVYAEFLTSLELSLDIDFDQSIEMSQTVGVKAGTSGIKPYFEKECEGAIELDMYGKVEARAGFKVAVGVSIGTYKAANISITAGFGVYARALVAVKGHIGIEDYQVDGCSYWNGTGSIEAGVYLTVGVKASLLKLPLEKDLIDKEFPLLQKEGSISKSADDCSTSTSTEDGSGDGSGSSIGETETSTEYLDGYQFETSGSTSVSVSTSNGSTSSLSFAFDNSNIKIDASIISLSSDTDILKQYTDQGYEASAITSYDLTDYEIEDVSGDIAVIGLTDNDTKISTIVMYISLNNGKVLVLNASSTDGTSVGFSDVSSYLKTITSGITQATEE